MIHKVPNHCVVYYGGYVLSGRFDRWLYENNIKCKFIVKDFKEPGIKQFFIEFENDEDAILYKLTWL